MENHEPDKYDRAVAFLTENPEQIDDIWSNPTDHEAGVLFQFCSKEGDLRGHSDTYEQSCGCLTEVASGRWPAQNEKLRAEIMADDRIPKRASHITVSTLPVFAEWQRRLDKELNRT